MKIPFVDLGVQYEAIRGEVNTAIQELLDRTSFVGGNKVLQFEQKFAEFVGVNHCVSCGNGTDALELALEAIGVSQGDEVIVPAFTWVSTASAVCRAGGKPIWADVHPEHYTLDPDKISEKISEHTKAILPVHFYGLPADMIRIMAIAESHDLKVVEDCAQAHGAAIDGRNVGTFGDVATFSFYPGKNLGAYGDGGAVVTNHASIADKVRVVARLGQREKHNHVAVGRNSRLDSIQAAILSIKLRYLRAWTKQRQQVGRWYSEALKDLPIKLPQIPEGFDHVFHLYVIQGKNRDKLKAHLAADGISTQIHYPKPLNQLTIFESQGAFPVSDAMGEGLLSLPMYAELNQDQVNYVAASIRSFYS